MTPINVEPASPDNENNPELGASDIFSIGGQSVAAGSGNDFNIMKYPQDVGSAEIPHYVMFYVNVRQSDLQDMENPGVMTMKNADMTKSNRLSTEAGAIAALSTGVGGLGGLMAGKALGGMIGGWADDLNKARAGFSTLDNRFRRFFSVTGGITGAAMGATAGSAFASLAPDRTQVMLKDAIALYLPGKPTSSYGASWTEEDLGLASQLGDVFSSKDGAMDRFEAMSKSTPGLVQAAVLKGADKLKNDIFGDIGGSLQAAAAQSPNPFKAQLFRSMGFRKFKFEYVFLPKNDTEYFQVKKIIKTFKKYMHPKLGAGKYILNYPAEFSIAYFYHGARNAELFKISNCALTSMVVDYGGTDFTVFKPFRGTKGAPTEISMHLEFLELEMLTQERIEQGF